MTSTPAEAIQCDWQATLFDDCALPGCPVPVATPGEVCRSCRTAFGDMLHARIGQPVREAERIRAELAARDAGVLAQYRDRAATGTVSVLDAIPRRNQACWLCEQRRTCTLEEMGWECAHCRDTVVA